MSDRPLVSVVVPAYNCARYVAEALRSALEQQYNPVEIIVVNDGSTDDTPEVIRTFGDRITLINQSNAGAAAARNAAIEKARGDYIAFLDSDDLWLPGKLAAQVSYLEAHPEIGMVYSAWSEWRTDSTGQFEPPAQPGKAITVAIDPMTSGWLYNRLLLGCIIHTTTVMIRSEIVKQVGTFDVSLRRGQDYDYWLRVSRVTPIHKLQNRLSLYRIHGESITHKAHPDNYGVIVIQKALDRWGSVGPDGTVTPQRVINRVLARLWFGFGYSHYECGDLRTAFDAFRHCVSFRPWWYGGWLNLLRSALRMGLLPRR
jgi:glycosyltransferase involved in cell wall biosynthesis